PPPRLGDPHPRDLHRLFRRTHALWRGRGKPVDALWRGRGKPVADKFGYLRDGEAVGEHNRLGAAIAAGGEQFERPAAGRMGWRRRGRAVGIEWPFARSPAGYRAQVQKELSQLPRP